MPESDRRTALRRAAPWARAAVAAGLLCAVGYAAGLGDLGGVIATLRWRPAAIAVALVPLSVAIRAYNHTLLANARVRILGPWTAMRLALAGAGIALLLPAGAADLAKAHYGVRVHGHAEDMIVSSALDKLTSLTAVAAMGALGAAVSGRQVLAWTALAIATATVLPFAAPRVVPWKLALKLLAPGRQPDDAVIRAVSRPAAGRLAAVYGISLLGWLVTYSVVYLCCLAVGAAVSPAYVLAMAPFTALARMLPVSVGGLGLGELTIAALLTSTGVEASLAARAALLAMVALVLLPGAVGLALVAAGGYSQRTLATSHGNEP